MHQFKLSRSADSFTHYMLYALYAYLDTALDNIAYYVLKTIKTILYPTCLFRLRLVKHFLIGFKIAH